MKRLLIALFALVLVVGGLSACSSNKEKTFTTEELTKFDGTNGNSAYAAIDGVVYDVSDVASWAEGKHFGLTAGHDWSKEIEEQSPHGKDALKDLPVVGKLK